jgi:hypothetical protein
MTFLFKYRNTLIMNRYHKYYKWSHKWVATLHHPKFAKG